jgi:hypothetical protein
MEVSNQLRAPTALRPEKERFVVRLGGSNSRVGHCGEEEYFLTLPGIEPLPYSEQPVAILTELSRTH